MIAQKLSFLSKSSTDKAAIRKVQDWIEQKLADIGDLSLFTCMVSQVQCSDPSCVPLETFVVILFNHPSEKDKNEKFFDKILKPTADVVKQDLDLLSFWDSVKVNYFQYESSVYLNRQLAKISSAECKKSFVNSLISDLSQMKGGLDSKLVSLEDSPLTTTVTMKPISSQRIPQLSMYALSLKTQDSGPQKSLQSSNIRELKNSIVPEVQPPLPSVPSAASTLHAGGTRPRGCPCCDPDNLDNLIEKMMFIENS